MSTIKTRFSNARSKLLRRGSAASTATTSSAASDRGPKPASSLRKSISLSKLPEVSAADVSEDADDQRLSQSEGLGTAASRTETEGSVTSRDRQAQETTTTTASAAPTPADVRSACPAVTLEEPTPLRPPAHPPELVPREPAAAAAAEPAESDEPTELPARSSKRLTPPGILRRQSLVTASNARVIRTLLEPDLPSAAVGTGPPTATDYFAGPSTFNAGMLHRKIWVKRPNASATLVQIREDDLVDDVRDMILKKYANSLGRSFDSPDISLRIVPRDSNAKSQDRMLGPEEEMCRTLDAYYPGGQTVNEALLIEVPKPRTPRPSPRVPVYYAHHDDAQNPQTEYFPPMPLINPSPAGLTAASHETRASLTHAPHSIAVLQTGQLPPLPSPGSTRRAHSGRPKYPRHNTASPTTLTSVPQSAAAAARPANRPRHDSSASETKHSATSSAPIPTPPAPADPNARQNSTPPTPRVASPRPEKKRKKQKITEAPSLPAGLLDGSVPPINVLIVEDNIINLRVLGAFMQRLKVRWQRAMNGKEAIEKWRAGGFHLVLMDIQLPIMDGLEATREIRRLERVNSIGVFSSGSNEAPNNRLGQNGKYDREVNEPDRLGDKGLFKSPVIIVALTASSLQSDRHEALAAGCNDFLTKVSTTDLFPALIANMCLACQLCVVRTKGQRMGLHAGAHRL